MRRPDSALPAPSGSSDTMPHRIVAWCPPRAFRPLIVGRTVQRKKGAPAPAPRRLQPCAGGVGVQSVRRYRDVATLLALLGVLPRLSAVQRRARSRGGSQQVCSERCARTSGSTCLLAIL